MKHYTKEEIQDLLSNSVELAESFPTLGGEFFYYCNFYKLKVPQNLFFDNNSWVNNNALVYFIEHYGQSLIQQSDREKITTLLKKSFIGHAQELFFDKSGEIDDIQEFSKNALDILYRHNEFNTIIDLVNSDIEVDFEKLDVKSIKIDNNSYELYLKHKVSVLKNVSKFKFVPFLIKLLNYELEHKKNNIDNIVYELVNFYDNAPLRNNIFKGFSNIDARIKYHPKFIDGFLLTIEKRLLLTETDDYTINNPTVSGVSQTIFDWVSNKPEVFSKSQLVLLFNKLTNKELTGDFFVSRLSLEDMYSMIWSGRNDDTNMMLINSLLKFNLLDQTKFLNKETNELEDWSIYKIKSKIHEILKSKNVFIDMEIAPPILESLSLSEGGDTDKKYSRDYEVFISHFENLTLQPSMFDKYIYYNKENFNIYIDYYLDNHLEFNSAFLNKISPILLYLQVDTLKRFLARDGNKIFTNNIEIPKKWLENSDVAVNADSFKTVVEYVKNNFNINTAIYYEVLTNNLPINMNLTLDLGFKDEIQKKIMANFIQEGAANNNIIAKFFSPDINSLSPVTVKTIISLVTDMNDSVNIQEKIVGTIINNITNPYVLLEIPIEYINRHKILENKEKVNKPINFNNKYEFFSFVMKFYNEESELKNQIVIKNFNRFFNVMGEDVRNYFLPLASTLPANCIKKMLDYYVQKNDFKSLSMMNDYSSREMVKTEVIGSLGIDDFIEASITNPDFREFVMCQLKHASPNYKIGGCNLPLPSKEVFSSLVDIYTADEQDDFVAVKLLSLFDKKSSKQYTNLINSFDNFNFLKNRQIIPTYNQKDKDKVYFTPTIDEVFELYRKCGGAEKYFNKNIFSSSYAYGDDLFNLYINAENFPTDEGIDEYVKNRKIFLEKSKEFPELYTLFHTGYYINHMLFYKEYAECEDSLRKYNAENNTNIGIKDWVKQQFLLKNLDIDVYVKGISILADMSYKKDAALYNKFFKYISYTIYIEKDKISDIEDVLISLLPNEWLDKIKNVFERELPLLYLDDVLLNDMREDRSLSLNLERLIYPSEGMQEVVRADTVLDTRAMKVINDVLSEGKDKVIELDYLVNDRFKNLCINYNIDSTSLSFISDLIANQTIMENIVTAKNKHWLSNELTQNTVSLKKKKAKI